MVVRQDSGGSALVDRVLDASQRCYSRWGVAKTTVDDIATESGVSRSTIYRLFPGGKDVMFETLRIRELQGLFALLISEMDGADTPDELAVRAVVGATRALRADAHLAVMLAAEPGTVLGQLTVDGVPRIIHFATAFMVPIAERYLDTERARSLIDLLVRLTISFFLAPSEHVDLTDEASARAFLVPIIASYVAAMPPTAS